MELLNKERQKELLAKPESGMGYQTVEVVLRDDKKLRGTVFNAEYLLFSNEPVGRLEKVADPSVRLQTLATTEIGSGEEIKELKVVTTANALGLVRESDESQTTGATEAEEEDLKKDEEFKRFSAFANDFRVTAVGGLLPGSYATTAADAKAHITTGSDAVRRYALPNPTPAVNVFTINPPNQTPLKRGVVQPAYGQPGGGVEVLFVNGSPPNTVISSPPPLPPLP